MMSQALRMRTRPRLTCKTVQFDSPACQPAGGTGAAAV